MRTLWVDLMVYGIAVAYFLDLKNLLFGRRH